MTLQRRARHLRPAFSLVEVVISIAILGVLMVAALNAVAYAARDRRFTNEAVFGRALAVDLAREVMTQRYADPHGSAVRPSDAVSRALFNNIEDYDGLREFPPKHRDGSLIPGATGWTRAVRIRRAEIDSDTGELIPDSDNDEPLLAFTVIVKSPGGKTYTLTAIRSPFGSVDIPTPDNGMYTSLRARLGAGEQTMTVSTDLPNLPAP